MPASSTQFAASPAVDLRPATLAELLVVPAVRLGHVDIARMNLLCASGLHGAETLDVEAALIKLDAWAAQAGRITTANLPEFHRNPAAFDGNEGLWRVVLLTRILSQEFGIHYSAKLKDAACWNWVDARDTMLCGLVGPDRSGSCPSLPVLLVAIARRLGYPLFLAHAPQHVLARWDGMAQNRGCGHANPAWRSVFNIEYNGDGVSDHPDDYYRSWPVKWTTALIDAEARRKPPLYLRPLAPPEELAAFLIEQSHILLANGQYDAAFASVQQACRYAPHNENHAACGVDIHHRKLVKVLQPWGMTPFNFCEMVRRRHAGHPVLFPWESMNMDPYRPGVPTGTPRPPEPLSPLSDPLRLAAEGVLSDLARPMPPELSLGLPKWVATHAKT